MRHLTNILFGLVAVAMALGAAGELRASDADEQTIRQGSAAFVEAFNKQDAAAIASDWIAGGDYVDQTGHELKGREAIEKSFTDFFAKNPEAHIQVDIGSIRFVTPDVALEDGKSVMTSAAGRPPVNTRYSAVHVKVEGRWGLMSLREAAALPPSNYPHLKELEFLLGNWIDRGDDGDSVMVTCTWSDHRNYLIRSFTSTFAGKVTGRGTQWIGWDAEQKQIRSWSFDSTGTRVTGDWSAEGENWVVATTEDLPGGEKVTSTETVTRNDDGTMTWNTTDRMMDGNTLPDTKITVRRIQ